MTTDSVPELPEPAGRVFAIGDVHGCLAELDTLLGHLITKRSLVPEDTVIFIGDYIDRGPDSRGVVDRLLKFRAGHENTFFLKGNHEDMLLSFLGGRSEQGGIFLLNGGVETAMSYGMSGPVTPDALAALLPPEHQEFFLSLDRMIVTPRFIFAHAGLNPLRDLHGQVDSDLFWIRDEFIQNIHHFEKTIVFGHTPFQEVLVHLPYKLGIDTGCVFGNALSCVELTELTVATIQAGGKKVKESRIKRPKI